jgi:hypothetical protein
MYCWLSGSVCLLFCVSISGAESWHRQITCRPRVSALIYRICATSSRPLLRLSHAFHPNTSPQGCRRIRFRTCLANRTQPVLRQINDLRLGRIPNRKCWSLVRPRSRRTKSTAETLAQKTILCTRSRMYCAVLERDSYAASVQKTASLYHITPCNVPLSHMLLSVCCSSENRFNG